MELTTNDYAAALRIMDYPWAMTVLADDQHDMSGNEHQITDAKTADFFETLHLGHFRSERNPSIGSHPLLFAGVAREQDSE